MNFIINRWVRGTDFFGREALLRQIQERKGKPTWVLGNRRAGKTSLLRQIHHLCHQGSWNHDLALYWDLQGAGSAEGLKEAFLECLEDNEEVTERLGLDIDSLEDASLGELLNKFRRKAKGLRDSHLFLLIDECEELVDITAREPGILAPFRKLSQGEYPFNIVMTGSWRMMDLDESDAITSPFLPDFLPPLLLEPFSQEESVALLTSRNLTATVAADIYELCHGNPHLLQVLGEHASRVGNLELALAELKHNKVGHYFFQSNFNCLPPEPRPWFAEGRACQELAQLDPSLAYFPQVAQSALVRLVDGSVKVNPLLYLIEADVSPEKVLANLHHPVAPVPAHPAPTSPAPPQPEVAPTAQHLLAPFLTEFSKREPQAVLGAASQPLQEVWQSTGDEALCHLLDEASPEYVRGKHADARTMVYLAGLHWYRQLAGAGPFAEITQPSTKVAAIAEQDVVITATFRDTHRLTAIEAMILLRCLRAHPEHRYPSLAQLAADLKITL